MRIKTDDHNCSGIRHNHLIFDLNDILRESKDDSTDFPGDTDGILGVQQLLVGFGGLLHKRPVDGILADSVNQSDEENSVLQSGIVEAGNLSRFSSSDNFLIGPRDDLSIGNLLSSSELVQQGDDLESHELPNYGEGKGLVGVHDVISLDSDQGEVELFSELQSVVVIFKLLVGIGGIPVDTFLIDNSWLDLVE